MTWYKQLKELAILLVVTTFFVAAPVVVAQESSPKKGVCEGVAMVTGKGCDEAGAQGEAEKKVKSTVELVVNILSWIVGIAAVLMVIVGGFKYVTSGGDSGKVTSAKNTIMFALIGLIIAVLAQVIVNFVIDTVDKSPAAQSQIKVMGLKAQVQTNYV